MPFATGQRKRPVPRETLGRDCATTPEPFGG